MVEGSNTLTNGSISSTDDQGLFTAEQSIHMDLRQGENVAWLLKVSMEPEPGRRPKRSLGCGSLGQSWERFGQTPVVLFFWGAVCGLAKRSF